MSLQRWARIWLGLAIALAGLIPGGTNVARGAELPRYVSSDFCAAMVIHPDRIGKSTLAEALKSGLPKEMASADPAAAAAGALSSRNLMFGNNKLPPGMDVAKLAKLLEGKTILRIVVLIDPMPTAGVPAAPAIILQFTDDIDGDGILAATSSDWQPAEAKGVKYKKLKNPEAGKPGFAALLPDARTLIVGLDCSVVKMLVRDDRGQPLLKQLQHTNFDNDIILEYLAEPALAAAAKGGGSSAEKGLAPAAGLAAMGPPKEIKSASATLNFSGKTLLHAEVATDTPETAAMFAAMARKAVADAKPKFEEMKKQPPPLVPPPAVAAISKLGDEVFEGLTVKSDGPRLVVDLPMPASLPDALKLAGQLAAQMAPKAGPPR